jgi:predicted protein tyrosine phosphatase
MIIVCSLREAQNQISKHGAKRAITILGPGTDLPRFENVDPDDHLRLTFHDVAAAAPGLEPPQTRDMVSLLSFLRKSDKSQPMVIHCWAGISRSTAAGYIATCLFRPQADEFELAEQLRAASPSATPNPMLIALADEALGRNGRMRAAIASIGRGADAFEGAPFKLEI